MSIVTNRQQRRQLERDNRALPEHLREVGREDWPENASLGISVCNDDEALRDIPKAIRTKLALRIRCLFLSLEPLLGPVSLRWLAAFPESAPFTAEKPGRTTNHLDGLRRIDWVIAGGESGHHARPASPDWFRTLRNECAAASVPYLFKQWGEWVPMLGQVEGVSVTRKATTPDGWVMGWAGKKAAGRLLDGRTHDEFPEVRRG